MGPYCNFGTSPIRRNGSPNTSKEKSRAHSQRTHPLGAMNADVPTATAGTTIEQTAGHSEAEKKDKPLHGGSHLEAKLHVWLQLHTQIPRLLLPLRYQCAR